MGKPTKTVADKLQTKLSKLEKAGLTVVNGRVEIKGRILLRYTGEKISYTRFRYFPSMKEDIVEENFTVEILLDHETLRILGGQPWNPPKVAARVLEMFRHAKPELDSLIIGSAENKIQGRKVFITYALYSTLTEIRREEGRDKVVRVRSRVAPFLKDSFDLTAPEVSMERDYSLLIGELLASKELTQADIAAFAGGLEGGDLNEVVIERQIHKQAAWLLDSMQSIVDEATLSATKSKELGSRLFGFPKASISGPEKLMEKILTKYGQNIIFGVPALLNVNEFVTSSAGYPRLQFDLLLVTILSDIEIVELKRPDEYLLEYDDSRNKFYMSKSLGTAAAQCERYISALYRDDSAELKIQGMSVKDYLQSKVGGTITLSICRPKALIVIGVIHRLAKPYEELSSKVKAKVTKKGYENNLARAYQELKATFRNIDVTTYSELIEGARLRLQIEAASD